MQAAARRVSALVGGDMADLQSAHTQARKLILTITSSLTRLESSDQVSGREVWPCAEDTAGARAGVPRFLGSLGSLGPEDRGPRPHTLPTAQTGWQGSSDGLLRESEKQFDQLQVTWFGGVTMATPSAALPGPV